MKMIKRALIVSVIFSLCLLVPAMEGFAGPILPTVNFDGNFWTTEGVGVGELQLYSTGIVRADYVEGTTPTYTEDYIAGVETIIGAEIVISGAMRTDDLTFDDALIQIRNDSHTYFSATLSDIEFIQDVDDGSYYLMNPNLDGDDPETLNMSNIVLGHSDLFPSLYIDQLGEVLYGHDASGMKMTIRVTGGDITGFSYGSIVNGLIDGNQPKTTAPIPEPGSLLLLGTGIAGLAAYRKRFKTYK